MIIYEYNNGVRRNKQMKDLEFRKEIIGIPVMLHQTNSSSVQGGTWTQHYELPSSIAFGVIQKDDNGFYVQLNEGYITRNGSNRTEAFSFGGWNGFGSVNIKNGFLVMMTSELKTEFEPRGLEDIFRIVKSEKGVMMLPKSKDELTVAIV